MQALREALAGYAEWLGYGHAERAGAWLERLEVNRAELDAFRAAPTPPGSPEYNTAPLSGRFPRLPLNGVWGEFIMPCRPPEQGGSGS